MFPDARYEESELIARTRNREHWVCFDCRKMFKRPARPENVMSGPLLPANPYSCPQCSRAMCDMGVYFEPPRRLDIAGWTRMKVLAEFGYGFYTVAGKICIERDLVGTPPASPSEVRRRLAHRLACSEAYSLRRNAKFLKEVRRHRAVLRRLRLS